MNVKQFREKYTEDYPGISDLTDRQLSKQLYNSELEKGNIKIGYDEWEDQFLINKPEDNITLYRQEYEKNNPELKEMSDLQIADGVYNYLSNKGEKLNYKKFVNTFAPKPTEYEDDGYYYLGPDSDLVSGPKEYSVSEIAEVTGIQQPSGEVFDYVKEAKRAGSYGVDQRNKALAYKNVLSKMFDQDVEIRIGPKTDEFEFLNPKTNKYTLLNKPGFDSSDVYGLEGDALVIMPELLGNLVGGAFGGPGALIAGGAVGAALGEAARLRAGQKLYGINKDLNFTDLLSESTKTGTLTGVFGAAGIGIPKVMKLVDNVIEGRLVAKDLEPFVKNAEKAQEIADELNLQLEIAGIKKKLKFNLAQASNDPDLLAVQAKFEASPGTATGQAFNKFSEEQAEALNAYFKTTKSSPYNVVSNEFPGKSIGYDEFGERLQNIAKQRQAPKAQELLDKLKNSEFDLTDATFSLSDGSVKPMGSKIKDLITASLDDVDKEFGKKYKSLFNANKGLTIKQDKIISALDKLTEQEKQNLFTKLPKIQDFIKPKTVGVEVQKLDKKGNLVTTIEQTPADEISIDAATNTLTAIKQFERQAAQKGETTPFGGALKVIKNSIDESIKDLGPDHPFVTEYYDLGRKYKARKDQFRSVLGDIVEVKNGRVMLADEDVFETTFKKGPSQMDRVDKTYDILQKKPENLSAYRDNILGFYKRKVVDPNTGIVNPRKHAAFMRDYEYGLKKFFDVDDAGFKQLEKIGNLSKKYDKINKNKSKVFQELNNTLEGQLANTDPDKIFDLLYNPKGLSKLRKGMEIMEKDPELLRAFRSVAKDNLETGIKDLNGKFDLNKFSKYLQTNDRNLETVFGKEYVDGLKLLRNSVDIAQRKGKIPREKAPIINNIARSYVGLFTREGRMLTVASKIYRRNADKLMAEMILDPEKVKTYVKLSKTNPKTEKALGLLTQLGAQEFFILPGDPRKQDIKNMPKGLSIDKLPTVDLNRSAFENIEMFPLFSPSEAGEINKEAEEYKQQSAVPQPQQPQGIAALPSQPALTQQTTDRGQQYAGLFPQDPLGQAIART